MDAYAEGLGIVSGFKDLDGPNVNPDCRTRVYTHGRRTRRALVLLHGFTNCPQQFDALGRQFHSRGWNVLIPRYPRHGYIDRLNTSVSELRAEDLIALANRSVDAAHGLGEHVTVAGLSLGGTLAAYLAQTHDRVDRAVLIAPMFGLKRIPGFAHPLLARTAYVLPNIYIWWDPKLKDRLPPTYGYPRFSTHAYAALFKIATAVRKQAAKSAPKASGMAVITNAGEPGLENRFSNELVAAWRKWGASVSTHEFAVADRLPHDLIDPGNPAQNTELVYPVVTGMIAG